VVAAPAILRWWLGDSFAAGATAVVRAGALMGVLYLLMNVLYNAVQARGRPILLLGGWLLALAVLCGGLLAGGRSLGITGVMLLVAGAWFAMGALYGLMEFRQLRLRRSAGDGAGY
jgi:O-antigen/teichoic acid export membrane protein